MTAPLDQAAALLDGRLHAGVYSVRAAAWVARSALEGILEEFVRAKGLTAGSAQTRSILGCIEVMYANDAPGVASQAQYAWDRLSQACHYHAYELSPTYAEVEALVDVVRRLEVCARSAANASVGA